MTPRTTTPPEGFASRHIGTSAADHAKMLADLGFGSLADLMAAALPADLLAGERCAVPAALDERAATARLRALAGRNDPGVPLIGMGYHGTVTPAAIRRNVLENPAWYTAYTPYQAEISQGRLEALLHFQTMVCELTGMALANASLLDEASAAAEGMALCHRAGAADRETFLVDPDVHPQTVDVVRTRARALGLEVAVAEVTAAALGEHRPFGVLLQYPGSGGEVRDLAPVVTAAHEHGALAVVAADLLACTLLRPPGEAGADVVVGHAQRFGVPLWYGGPHAGYIATREQHRRSLPGRLVGVSVDSGGRAALRLALQAREQHIRRERATSNICTAQSLPAIASVMYAIFHGPEGLAAIAERVHGHTARFAAALAAAGVEVVNDTFFDTVTVRVPSRAAEVLAAAREAGYELRPVDADTVGVAFDETTTDAVVTEVAGLLGATPAPTAEPGDGGAGTPTASPVPDALRRRSPFLRQPVFREHRSETALMRLARRLGDRDLALDRGMIPLGSCTMKLNAAAELEPISWPGFADVHPFVPVARAAGLHELMRELEGWLAELTGFDAVSLQPNAGSQGELAGLLAIRRYHEVRGEPERKVVLIPASAHGTNAASAALAGLTVEVVDCDERGNVDLDDLTRRAEARAGELAGLMITYPSTHGVFEPTIRAVCEVIHRHGGQVYFDGANLNALVGWSRPAELGADVAHLNLHKTFAIPHGGGGPGVGPVGVRAHLAEHLPGHGVVAEAATPGGVGPVAAAPYGSAGILPISWAYVAMMGRDGLEAATAAAVLAANYVAHRLEPHFPVLYRGPGGLVAHECILDLRPLTEATGVTAEDVAKRLIDFGFHAPTMSFPVAGTLMVEPTESEPLAELDRFCDAMIAIRAEIADVAEGRVALAGSPLRHAPHPAADVLADGWDRPYSRAQAAYPAGEADPDKYWPPVGRIDNAYGDRHPVCACPPLADWRDPVGEAAP